MGHMEERRNDTRLLCADLIELIWTDHSGQERRRIANLEDISPCGISVQMEMLIRAGTPIRVTCGQAEFSGTVRHSHFRERAYFIGIEFDENSRWTEQDFVPEHLLDPREIVERVGLSEASKVEAAKWIN